MRGRDPHDRGDSSTTTEVEDPRAGVQTQTPWTGGPTGPCEQCGQRPATEWWVGDGNMLSAVHGGYRAWCEVCCVEAQLAHAEAAAARIPELRAKLDALLVKGRGVAKHMCDGAADCAMCAMDRVIDATREQR